MNSTLFTNRPPPRSRPAPRPFRAAQAAQSDVLQGGLVAAATTAVWMGCLVVGIVGVLLPYAREHLQAKPPPVVQAVRLLPPREQAPDVQQPRVGPKIEAAAPPPESPAPAEAPPPMAVAAPNAPVAFAVPVEGPTRIADVKYAVPVAAPPPAPLQLPVHHLTFGVGEGHQPDPEYPQDAILAGEQGTVVVRFTVGDDGRVLSAVVSQPSRWPLLNQAALRAVRDSWRLSRGKTGTYDIPIQFELHGKNGS